jgi:hypothetical protein
MSFECVVFNLIAGVALTDKKELADQMPALHVTTLLAGVLTVVVIDCHLQDLASLRSIYNILSSALTPSFGGRYLAHRRPILIIHIPQGLVDFTAHRVLRYSHIAIEYSAIISVDQVETWKAMTQKRMDGYAIHNTSAPKKFCNVSKECKKHAQYLLTMVKVLCTLFTESNICKVQGLSQMCKMGP